MEDKASGVEGNILLPDSGSLRSHWLEIFLIVPSCFRVSLSVVLAELENLPGIPNSSVLALSLVMGLIDHLCMYCLSSWTKQL